MRDFTLKTLTLTLALAASSGAQAVPIDLGTLDAVGADFRQDFVRWLGVGSPLGDFSDEYTFNLSASAAVLGDVESFDLGFVGLSLTSVSLLTAGNSLIMDFPAAGSFDFGTLDAGHYNLIVNGTLSGTLIDLGTAYYEGTIRAAPPATSVPEPATLGLFGAGALLAAFLRRRDSFK